MSIVSNASPLISLARIGKLDLLRQLYGVLFIPEAVWHEVVIEGVGQPGADEVKAATWIKTKSVTNTPLVHALRQELVKLELWWPLLAQKMIGHYQYYGISGNIRGLQNFYYHTTELAFIAEHF